jgi:hypothetical protein
MCRGGVGSILVMFNVLNCYILYMCLLLFVYCIPILEAPRPGADKTGFFLKKNPPMNIRAMWGRRGWSGLPHGSYVRGINEHKTNVALGWLRDYVAYVHLPEGTDERKGLRFVGSAWPTNVR